MNSKDLDDSSNLQVSYRSPTYNKLEVKTLISYVENFKSIILNKSINSTSNHAKDIAWIKIAKLFNDQGFKHTRSVDSLKTKWENLKKEARKLSKNLIDVDYNDYNYILSKVVNMMNEIEKNDNNTEISDVVPDSSDTNLGNENGKDISEKYWDEYEKLSEQSMDGDSGVNLRFSRSMNFSPQECGLLLKCVRNEKDHIFYKGNTGKAIKSKNNAWTRITYSFNKLSAQKRTTKTLRTKFRNMKQLAKNITSKTPLQYGHKKIEDDKEMKPEPSFECSGDMDEDSNSDNESISNHNKIGVEMPDPLSTVLNGDLGTDPTCCFGLWNQPQEQEVVKLKLELLKYQLETAKLERKRLLEQNEAENVERKSKAIETSLRLRAARLAVAAAENQLPSSHPALQYLANEINGQQYIDSVSKN